MSLFDAHNAHIGLSLAFVLLAVQVPDCEQPSCEFISVSDGSTLFTEPFGKTFPLGAMLTGLMVPLPRPTKAEIVLARVARTAHRVV